jgi:DNA invertase Pin-like site-specific DNA recombinase
MTRHGTRAVGYVRVSTQDQADAGTGLEVQRRLIQDEVRRRGWELVAILEDAGASGKSRKGRPGLDSAVGLVRAGHASVLVAAKVDRLARSLLDFAALMDEARRDGWALVVLDADFDMTTASGRAMAGILAVFAEFERERISERTRSGLAVKRSQGVHVGRRSTLAPRLVDRIMREHAEGRSLGSIAADLNRDAIPTGQGGAKWYASTVRSVVVRTSGKREVEDACASALTTAHHRG